jgi:integrase
VPVSRRLRKELVRYLNRVRPDTDSAQLLVRLDGKPIRIETITELFQRIRKQSGFPVHAHKFRHTFATEYLRQGGDIEKASADPRAHELRHGHQVRSFGQDGSLPGLHLRSPFGKNVAIPCLIDPSRQRQ